MREYALVFAVAAAATYLLTPLARRFAIRVHAMADVRDRDVHAVPTPRLGGIAMYAGITAALLVASKLPLLGTVFRDSSEPRAVLVAAGLICLLGALDDRFGLDALTKLAGQIVAAGVMVMLGVQLSYLPVPGGDVVVLSQEISVPLTVLVTVILINSVNFVDGLDGLAAGVVAIAALASFAYSYQLSATYGVINAAPATLFAAVLAGACIGFLPHNFAPATLFMGDSGSMLIGLVLAAATVSVTGQVDFGGFSNLVALPSLVPLLVPILVLAVPFIDLVLAVLRRARARRSPFEPDKMHLHHRLLEIGHSTRRAVLLMYYWAALIGFGGVTLAFSQGPWLVLSVVAVLAALAIFVISLPKIRGSRSAGTP